MLQRFWTHGTVHMSIFREVSVLLTLMKEALVCVLTPDVILLVLMATPEESILEQGCKMFTSAQNAVKRIIGPGVPACRPNGNPIFLETVKKRR